jgi:hypothetical protein
MIPATIRRRIGTQGLSVFAQPHSQENMGWDKSLLGVDYACRIASEWSGYDVLYVSWKDQSELFAAWATRNNRFGDALPLNRVTGKTPADFSAILREQANNNIAIIVLDVDPCFDCNDSDIEKWREITDELGFLVLVIAGPDAGKTQGFHAGILHDMEWGIAE